MGRIDRVLLNQQVQRLGALQALVSVCIFLWGAGKGQNPFIVVGIVLMAVTVLVHFWPRIADARGDANNVTADLTHAETEVIRLRMAAEAAYEADPNSVAGPFSVWLGDGHGFVGGSTYGSLSMADARGAFDKLQERGVVTRAGKDGEELIYGWTELGRKVAAIAMSESAEGEGRSKGINWVRSRGRVIRPKVRGYDTGIHIEDSPDVDVEDADIED